MAVYVQLLQHIIKAAATPLPTASSVYSSDLAMFKMLLDDDAKPIGDLA